jgi:hypothetical protein
MFRAFSALGNAPAPNSCLVMSAKEPSGCGRKTRHGNFTFGNGWVET